MSPETPVPLPRPADLLALARAEIRRESLAESTPAESSQAARWLCLVPAWTPVLATRSGLPGWTEAGGADVLDRWQADGLVETLHTPLTIDDTAQVAPPQHLFWMPRQTRAAWLSRLTADDGRDACIGLTREIALRILGQPRDRHMPTATWRWATVAAHATSRPPTLRHAFQQEIDDALAKGRPDEAWLWIEALQRVADVVPGEATTLHQRAVRRLALFDRQRNDRAMLQDYLPRLALFEAYRDVVAGPDHVWALHFLGGGGVGKTMLMRALTSGTAEHRPPGFVLPPTVTARIDFDHIDPDYPTRRPGLLFAHLAEELRLEDDSLRASEGFALLFNKIALIHERARTENTPTADVDAMLDVFAWACDAVARSRNARVALLLDTCEELARLGPDGRLPRSVERTFELLEQLHARMPSLRVVFCGRRPLAGTYAGGDVITSLLPPRPWLRLHRVSAFSEDEAKAYLNRAHVPDRLVPAILSRSLAAASSATLGLPPEPTPRYSPFSLSVYATWIAREGHVEADAITGDRVDHFVRIRILDRIHNGDVRRLLPHVALLGRFDDATLRACADLRPDVADAVLREMGSQEWIERQPGGSYAVEPELRARLLGYFERESARELVDARRRVLPVLWQALEDESLPLPEEAVVAALVPMVRGDRESLLRIWRTLDTRLTTSGQAAWGARVLGRLLADETALASDDVDSAAWGALMTTYAECVLHEQGGAATADVWRRAWDGAQALQDPRERASVLMRVAAGGLTAAAETDASSAFDLWMLRLYNRVTDRSVDVIATGPEGAAGQWHLPAHAATAALMACADAAERRADPLEPAHPLLERTATIVAETPNAPARAVVLACIGRFAARRQDADLARKRFVDALQTLADSADRELLPGLQWPRHLDPTSWVTLEAMRGLAGLEPVEGTLARFAALPTPRSAVAANRLESLRLRLTAASLVAEPEGGLRGEGDPNTARPTAAIAAGDVAVPETVGQIAVPPRAVAVALRHVESGRPAVGLRLLGELTSVAYSARNTAVAAAVERARTEAITRMRLGELGGHNRQLVAGAGVLPLIERERMRAFVPDATGPALDDDLIRTRWDAHCVWRATRAFGPGERHRLGEDGRRMLTRHAEDGQGEWARASVAIDLVECSELGADVDLTLQGLAPASPEDWWSRHPALPEQALRLWIRSAALGVSPGGPTTQLVRCLGVRRAAAIAMEEGELLALRLPTPALRLLALSLTWYEDAHDPVGTWQATTLLALTRVRAGVPRDGIDLTALQAAHESLFKHRGDRGGDFPPWSRLVETTELPLPGVSEWAPWLHRVVALHHWVTGGVRPEVLFTSPQRLPVELREWPMDGPGTAAATTSETRAAALPTGQASEGPQLPASRSPSPPPSATVPVPPRATRPRKAVSPKARPESGSVPVSLPAEVAAPAVPSAVSWMAMAVAGAILLALALLALWFLAVRAPERSLTSSSTPPGAPSATAAAPDVPAAAAPPSPGRATAAGGTSDALPSVPMADGDAPPFADGTSTFRLALGSVVVALAVACGWWWVRRRQRVPTSPDEAPPWVARVAASSDRGALDPVAALDVHVSIADGDGHPVANPTLRVRKSDAFAGLDAQRQPPAGTALSAPLAVSPPVERLWLEVGLSAAWPCWEVLLWSGTPEAPRLHPTVVRFLRPSQPARPVDGPPDEGPWPLATVSASLADERQGAYAWEPSLRAGRVALTAVTAEAVRAGEPMTAFRLVHVTAQPVETSHGLFLEVTAGSPHVRESLESIVVDRGTLFDASQLAHTFPRAACMLLQPPRRPALDLTPAGRETCASLRSIAAALADQGIPLVIVMPPLDGEVAAHVVRLLGRRVPRLRGGTLDPHEFARRAREIVFGHAQRLLPRDAAIELALQVTVHAL